MDKRYAVIGIVVVVAVIAVAYFSFNYTGNVTVQDYGDITEALREYAEGGGKLPEERPDYLPAEVYKNLPPFPKDFYEIDALLTFSKFIDLRVLGPEYYKQPEFIPEWESEGVTLMRNPEKGRYGIWGWGAYPADQGYTALAGDDFTAITYFHTSWNIQSYQGMQMEALFPEQGSVNGIPISQDSNEVKNYFDVSLSPSAFVIGPTFPIFDENWTQRVDVMVKISPDTPPGTYLIGVNPTAPPPELENEWRWQYRLHYANAGSTGLSRPFFQLMVEVREPGTEA